jgi:hypothetical protein
MLAVFIDIYTHCKAENVKHEIPAILFGQEAQADLLEYPSSSFVATSIQPRHDL